MLVRRSSQPYQGKCKDCKSTVTQNKAKYCHGASPSCFLGLRGSIFGLTQQAVRIRKDSARYAGSRFSIQRDMSCPVNELPLGSRTLDSRKLGTRHLPHSWKEGVGHVG